jgi:hypothetical protein
MTDHPEPGLPRLTDAEGRPIELNDSPAARAFRKAMAGGTHEPSAPISMWWTLSRPGGGGVHLRVTLAHRWTLTDVYVHGPAVTATDLQAVPVTDLDLLLNLIGGWDPWTVAEA